MPSDCSIEADFPRSAISAALRSNPRYLRRVGALCVALACVSITVLADAVQWPAGILAVTASGCAAVLYDRAHMLEHQRERLAELVQEYERDA